MKIKTEDGEKEIRRWYSHGCKIQITTSDSKRLEIEMTPLEKVKFLHQFMRCGQVRPRSSRLDDLIATAYLTEGRKAAIKIRMQARPDERALDSKKYVEELADERMLSHFCSVTLPGPTA